MKLKYRALLSLSLSLSRKPVIYITLVLLIFGAFFSALFFISPAKKAKADSPNWYNSSWQYRKKIIINHTKVSADQTNFPVYIDLSSDSDLAANTQVGGDDILFTSADGVTKLDHETISTPGLFPAGGAWCWFQNPRAVHYEGTKNQTYMGWVDTLGNIKIGSYDHGTETMSEETLHTALQVDDHASPSILIRPDGRLIVFYAAHLGDQLYYKLSTNPEDISSWGAEQTVGTNTVGSLGYTYSNPVQLSSEGNKIYLFWRGGNNQPSFSTSTDGISWSVAKTLFSVPGQKPYMDVVSDGTGKIHFTFTDGNPTTVANNNIYYAYYYNGAFYKADGTFIKNMADIVAGNPLLPTEIDKIYDATAGGSRGWNWDIALDSSGNPVIVYANFPTTSDHRYRYTRWTGSSWLDHEITPAGGYIGDATEPYYSGGIALDHENPSIVYLSREISGVNEIEKWTTSDNGTNWSSESITSGSSKDNVRPVVPRGHTSGDLGVIWMSGDYNSYTSYATSFKMQPLSMQSSVSEAHVKIPTLSSSVDTDIYMYYGNPNASNQSNPAGVWDSNYKMVQHLNNALGSSVDDSTTYNNDGAKTAINKPNEVDGKINRAQNYNGSDDTINTGTGVNMASWNALTFEAWVKYEKGAKTTTKYTMVSNWVLGTAKAAVMTRIEPTGDTLQAYVVTQPNTTVGGGFADMYFDSNWHHLVVTYNTSNGLEAYLDGVKSATSYVSSASLDADASSVLYLGNTPHETIGGFEGSLDEVRISNTARSINWISTEYRNQNSPATFYSVGSESVLAAVPSAPTVNVTSSTSLTTIINTNGNVDATEYAISCDGDTTFLNHSTNACEAIADDANHWRTYANWGGINGFINTGLTADTAHTYKVKARNGDYIETALSGGTTQTTLATHTLVYSAGANGSVVGTSPQTVVHGASGTGVTATPAAGYHFVCWSDSVLTAARTDTNVTADITVAATFISNEIITPEAIVEEITGTLHDYNVSTPYVYFSAPPAHAFDLPFTFDASDSFSAEGIAKYGWDFGDGATAEGIKVDHQYQSPGRYTVTLTVTDKAGKTATKQQTVDANPSKPTIEDISADGNDLVFTGKSYSKTIVHLEIHSNPLSVQTNTDDNGLWTYRVANAKEVLGAGDHTILASASYVLADQTELKSEPSKTYDFQVSLDDGNLKVEMKKTRTWQYISLGLVLLIVIGFLLKRFRKGKIINR